MSGSDGETHVKKTVRHLIEMYKGLSTPAKASIWFLICNILQMGLNVLTTPVFTRIMSQEEFGITNTYNSWRSILMIFTSLNLSYGVFNNAMVRYEDSRIRDQYVSSMQGLYCLITITFFGIYLIFQKPLNALIDMPPEMIMLLFADLLTYPALLFWSGRQRYEFKYRWLAIVTITMSVVNVAAGILSVYFSDDKAMAKVASNVIVNVVFCGFFLLYHFIKGRKLLVWKFWKYALAFNIPLIPHYLSEMILTQSDRIMITKYDSAAATANYSIAYSIVLIMQMITSAISASYVPWAYGCLKHKDYNAIKKMGNILLLLISGCVFLLTMFVPEIIYVFAGKSYMDSIYCIPPIALSILFIYLYELFSTVEFFYEKNIFVMIASVVAAALNVFLNWHFIPIYGYYAAGYTTLFCYILYAVGHYFVYKFICKKELKIKAVYDGHFIFIVIFFMCVFTAFVNMFYDKQLFRYLAALAVIVVMFIKRNVLIEKLKVMKEKVKDE